MNVLQTQASPELVAAQAAQANITGATMASFGVGQPSVTLTIRLIMQGKVSKEFLREEENILEKGTLILRWDARKTFYSVATAVV